MMQGGGRKNPAGDRAPHGTADMTEREFKKYLASVPASTCPASVPWSERKVQVAAAKARITIDRRLGVDTPEWIIALSKEKTPYL